MKTMTDRSMFDGFVENITSFFIGKKTSEQTLIDECEISAIVERAWIENAEQQRLGYAGGFARARFQEVVGKYVRAYRQQKGDLPIGDHDVLGNGRAHIYFAPRPMSFNQEVPRRT